MGKKYIIGIVIPKEFLKNKNLENLEIHKNSDKSYPKNFVVFGIELELEDCYTHISEILSVKDDVETWLVENDMESFAEDIGIICI